MLFMERLDIFCYSLQFSKIEIVGSAAILLKFKGTIKEFEHVRVEEFEETSFKSIKLCFTLCLKQVFNISIHEILSIFFGNQCFSSTLYQFNGNLFAIAFHIDCEVSHQNVFQWFRGIIF